MTWQYIARRVTGALLLIFITITLNFVLFRAIPGDGLSALRCEGCSQEFRDYQREQLGLDDSLLTQYGLYLEGLAHGDLGRSLENQEPVTEVLADPIKRTIPMVALGTFLAAVLGILIGLACAWRRGGLLDRFGLWTSLAFYSMPSQWLGLMIVLYVAPVLGLPTSGVHSPTFGVLGDPSTWDAIVDQLRHMILPALTMGLVACGSFALIVRSAMLDTLGEDYILTARAKGLSTRRVMVRHSLRNSMLPVTTLIALSIGTILSGAIAIEYVFSYPGIGYETVQAIGARDYAVLQGIFLLLTVSVIGCNLIADLLYPIIDPRVATQ